MEGSPRGFGRTKSISSWTSHCIPGVIGSLPLHATRHRGLSQLRNPGLPALVSRDADDYVRIATTLARDLPRLAEMRSTLRERMERSALMDTARFTHGIEAA